VKKLIQRELLAPLLPEEIGGNQSNTLGPTPGGLGATKLSQRRSALLFGPPGTSKTSLVEAVAERLGWPYLEITPSHFLQRGLEQIYVQANAIFEDLMDLSGVVILFDEMDALVQRREGGAERIDVTRQFLTTSMLPKLAKLHKKARVLFFMATNHQREFDPAIKRPGRFDLLVRMGPPTWEEKLRGLRKWLREKTKEDTDKEVDAVKTQLEAWGKEHTELRDMLSLFTFGEMNELMDHLRRTDPSGRVSAQLGTLKYDGFRALVKESFENTITLRRSDKTRNPTYDEFEADRDAVKVQ
jgi:SpoVK/Ycf46/Vps4 family AAA+-type ATPase